MSSTSAGPAQRDESTCIGGRGGRLLREHRARAVLLLLMAVAIGALAATEPLHRVVVSVVDSVGRMVTDHALAGAMSYVLLSALAAMVVFVSTAVITPVAVEAFGLLPALLLLWLGWILGGVTAYAVGRFLGPRVAAWFIPAARLHDYEAKGAALVTFRHVLLFQLCAPSEIPGYVLGIAGCRFGRFLAGMALGELPYALGAVYLGESFLQRNYLALVVIAVAGVALSWLALRWVRPAWSALEGVGKPTEIVSPEAEPLESSAARSSSVRWAEEGR